ncbi:MAG: DUF86 domain-containing protein [Bacteroidales bacterium]|nr:DUF86 domain-containing protein [Bacteroidales bacterium]
MNEQELQKIRTLYNALDKIQRFTEDINSAAELLENPLIWDAVKMNLVLVAEMDRKILPEVKEKYHSVPWSKIRENKPHIVSEFLGFDVDEVWKAITEKLPDFKKQLEELFEKL